MEFNKTNYFNKISYNKYKNISKFLWLSSCGLYVADNILLSQISSLGLDNSLIMLELSTLLSYIYMELSNNNYQVTLKNKDSRLLSTYKDYKRLNSELKKDMTFISLNEENEMIKSTLNICNLNLDLFENFYNTNKELYNELSNKFQKKVIKKNI